MSFPCIFESTLPRICFKTNSTRSIWIAYIHRTFHLGSKSLNEANPKAQPVSTFSLCCYFPLCRYLFAVWYCQAFTTFPHISISGTKRTLSFNKIYVSLGLISQKKYIIKKPLLLHYEKSFSPFISLGMNYLVLLFCQQNQTVILNPHFKNCVGVKHSFKFFLNVFI